MGSVSLSGPGSLTGGSIYVSKSFSWSGGTLATPIEMLDRLWAALDEGAEVAIGSRATSGSNIKRSQSTLRLARHPIR